MAKLGIKNAILLHGAGETPDSFWFPYLKTELEKRGCLFWCPQLPDADKINTEKQINFILDQGRFDEDTIIIGHSSACQLVLSILENLKTKIFRAVLVSGCVQELFNKANNISGIEYRWGEIKRKATSFVFINSDNDPWRCDDAHGRYMFDRLGGILVITHDGHMGSTRFNQPYKEFPLLVKFIE